MSYASEAAPAGTSSVITETNDFFWPGPDIRSIPESGEDFAYGILPPRFSRI
jgi:hypothetical protein